jgi:hypothetical protein
MDDKAQTGIELLLLIGGAVLVALMAGVILKGIATDTGQGLQEQIEKTEEKL